MQKAADEFRALNLSKPNTEEISIPHKGESRPYKEEQSNRPAVESISILRTA